MLCRVDYIRFITSHSFRKESMMQDYPVVNSGYPFPRGIENNKHLVKSVEVGESESDLQEYYKEV